MAIIRLRRLKLEPVIGTHPHERGAAQTIWLDLEFEYDARAAAAADALAEAVDYEALANRLTSAAGASAFLLLEALAEHLLELVLADRRVRWARVVLGKPAALAAASGVEVEMEGVRRRLDRPQAAAVRGRPPLPRQRRTAGARRPSRRSSGGR